MILSKKEKDNVLSQFAQIVKQQELRNKKKNKTLN